MRSDNPPISLAPEVAPMQLLSLTRADEPTIQHIRDNLPRRRERQVYQGEANRVFFKNLELEAGP